MIGLNTNPRSKTEVVTSFKDQDGNETIITGKDAYLVNFDIEQPLPDYDTILHMGSNKKVKLFKPAEPITLKFEFKLTPFDKDGNSNYIIDSFANGFKPKIQISKLRVEDCSINELLFAVRKKIKIRKDRKVYKV